MRTGEKSGIASPSGLMQNERVYPVKGSPNLIIIQPTPFCNINCRYCYLPNRQSSARMSFDTLTKVYDFLFSSPQIFDEKVTMVWHAGEPLAVPISFYEIALQLLKRTNIHGVKVEHAFQTNGTLITQKWCDFIKTNNISIGVSLDGPRFIHDVSRVDRRGRGTFDRTMVGIELLQRNDIKFHVIMVLTEHALNYPDEIWRFFSEYQMKNLAFNVEEVEGINKRSTLQAPGVIEKYKAFWRRLLWLREEDKSDAFIREVDYSIDVIRNGRGDVRGTENTPLSILQLFLRRIGFNLFPRIIRDGRRNLGQFHFRSCVC